MSVRQRPARELSVLALDTDRKTGAVSDTPARGGSTCLFIEIRYNDTLFAGDSVRAGPLFLGGFTNIQPETVFFDSCQLN